MILSHRRLPFRHRPSGRALILIRQECLFKQEEEDTAKPAATTELSRLVLRRSVRMESKTTKN